MSPAGAPQLAAGRSADARGRVDDRLLFLADLARRPAHLIAARNRSGMTSAWPVIAASSGRALFALEAGFIERLAHIARGKNRPLRRQLLENFFRVAQPGHLGRLVVLRDRGALGRNLRVLHLAARVMVLRHRPALAHLRRDPVLLEIRALEGRPADIPILRLADKMPAAFAGKIRVHRPRLFAETVAGRGCGC